MAIKKTRFKPPVYDANGIASYPDTVYMETTADLVKIDDSNVELKLQEVASQLSDIATELTEHKEDYTNLFEIGRNMFDKSKAIIDKSVNQTTGVTYALANSTSSDYIPVNELTKYSMNGGNIRIAYYRADKSFISGVYNPILPITTPVGARYVRYSITSSGVHVNIFNLGETLLPYEPYKEVISQNYLDINILLLDTIKGTKQKPYFTNGVITKLEHINISDSKVVRTDNFNFSIANKIVETRVDAYSNSITLTTDLITFETEVI